MEEPLYALFKRCTVRVIVPTMNASGSGFFIAPGFILTCAHVVEQGQAKDASIEVHWENQSHPAQLQVLLPKPYPDLALLRINRSDHPCVYLHDGANPGNFLYGYGYTKDYARGEPVTFEYEGVSWTQDQEPHLKMKAGQALPGLSGAPLLNWQTGSVCAILQKTRDPGSDLGGRAVPTNTILQALSENGFQIRDLQEHYHQQNTQWIQSLTQLQRLHLGFSTTPSNSTTTIEIFYSYAHEDEKLRNELAKHLKLLQRQGLIREWHDRNVSSGEEWSHKIDTHLNVAQIILLLVSPDFITSDYCYDIEMMRAMERHDTKEARVIPIILRPTDGWHAAPFGKLKALPKDGKAVTTWTNRDTAYVDIAKGIRKIVEDLIRGIS